MWGPLSLSPGRVRMTQFLPFPYTQVTPLPQTPHMEPESRVASGIVCPHKGQQSLSVPDVAPWPRLQLYPSPLPSARAAYRVGWQDSA